MSDGSKIEWTDATWNVINGCSVVSPGCKHCYAMKQAHRFPIRQGLTERTAGGMVWTGDVRFHEPFLDMPLRWKRPRRIFVCAHGDLFHEKVPDEWIDRVFAVMALAPQHQFQVLTKRPERARVYLTSLVRRTLILDGQTRPASPLWNKITEPALREALDKRPLSNVWLGTSVEDQKRADERIPELLASPAAIRWLSCEPLLGPIQLRGWLVPDPGIDWVVVGGESGPGARPMHSDWVRAIRDQCEHDKVPFFCKQLSGERGRAIKDVADFPSDLRIREYPNAV